jgi:hypothetical protein
MKLIEIEDDIYNELGQIASPFIDRTPSMVIRKLLDHYSETISSREENESMDTPRPVVKSTISQEIPTNIRHLKQVTPFVHPAFLTFLLDKYYNSTGNFRTSEIVSFMESMNLRLPSGLYMNPWMKAPYGGRNNGATSCVNTIEHFRQARKFGCWNGKNTKINCNAKSYCIYHPDNEYEITNKCDLRYGIIWKRNDPNSPFEYGHHYEEVVENELLKNQQIPTEVLLAVIYPREEYRNELVDRFLLDFNIDYEEADLFSDSDIWKHAQKKGLIP